MDKNKSGIWGRRRGIRKGSGEQKSMEKKGKGKKKGGIKREQQYGETTVATCASLY